jgi:uncharacterized lipoprotein YddW (UPF0748 family)
MGWGKKSGVLWSMMGLLFSLWGSAAGYAEESNRSFRAFWVDAFHDGVKTPDQVDKLLADVKEANANAVIVQVRRRGDAYFNQALEPRTQDPGLQPGYDPLADLIQKAHASQPRIEVHAWLATLPIWNSETPPLSDQHVFNQHGPSVEGRDYWLMERVDGVNRNGADYVLDPGHPDALDYTADQYVNVVRHYAVDGIHLDLVRYMGSDWGYNPTALERYQKQTGTADKPAPDDPRWKAWRREQVDHLMRQVYLRSIAIRPDVKVSAAVIAWQQGPSTLEEYRQSAPYQQVLQDWNGWLEEGIIDMAIPMNYDREHVPLQKEWFDQWIAWEKDHQHQRHIAAGPGIYLNAVEGSLAQIRRAMTPSAAGNRLAGVSLYSYAVTNKDGVPSLDFFRALSKESAYGQPVFSEKAEVPEMPWKSQPTKGYLMGRLVINEDTADNREVIIRGDHHLEYRVRTDGNGFFGKANLAPGYYVVQVKSGSNSLSRSVVVEAGRVAEVNIREK